MASGQIFILYPNPPGQKYAQEDIVVATSTATGDPYIGYPVWSFDAATGEYMHFYGQLQGYGGGGLTLTAAFNTTTATSAVVWGAALRRLLAASENIEAAHTWD